ncbi:MAG: L-aspartate oxidase [Phycisphaerales bacterium]
MDSIFHQRRYLIPFRSSLLPQIFTDTLVIGAGVAGLRAAVSASTHGEVIVLAKGDFKHTNTAWAQGGIAGVFDEHDTIQSHYEDTLTAGAGLVDEPVAKLVVREGPRLIEELFSWGMKPDRDAKGKLQLGREGGHAHHRIIHSNGDATGAEVQRALLEKIRTLSTQGGPVRVFEKCFALDLITPNDQPGAPVMGAITHHPKHGLQMIWAKATILASGGAGQLFRETTNPPQATADGCAMAFRAGAALADMAFTQFHPTTLYLAGASRSLITEAIRGAGAHLLDARGHRFMLDIHPLAELAPRDVVSQAIVRQIARQAGEGVTLDCRGIKDFDSKFPSIAAILKKFGLDASKDLIPVHPAMHYMVGGVRTDAAGRTNVPGLYAAGEVASSGLHGANRLASNSLLEGLVFGEITGRVCAEMKSNGNSKRENANDTPMPAGFGPARPSPVPIISDIRPSDLGELDLIDVRTSLRSAMWKNVGIERTGQKLSSVCEMIDFWARYTLDKIFDDPAGWETQNMLTVAAMIARSAAWRSESRGCHHRLDYPQQSPQFHQHDLWQRNRSEVRVESVMSA